MPPTQGMPPILIKAPHLEAGTSKVDNDLSLGHIPTVLPLTMEAASRLMSLQRMVLL
jgi:hypothetical protein